MFEVVTNPPPHGLGSTTGRVGYWEKVAASAVAAKGQWIKLPEEVTNTAGNIKIGRLAPFRPAGSFDAVGRDTRKIDGGGRRATVYVRFVGEPDE